MLIRELAQKLDEGFRKGKVHEGGSLESALFRGGSDDVHWDARLELDLILDEDGFVEKRRAKEYEACGSYITEEREVKALDEIRVTFSDHEMAMLEELKYIFETLSP